MSKHTLCCLLLCLLTACSSTKLADITPAHNAVNTTSPVAPPAATSTPIALQFQGSNMVRLDLPPDARPTEAAPTLMLAGLIVDGSTGQQVKGAVYLGEKLVASDVAQFSLTLPGELEEWLIVKADGYHDWKVRVRYRIHHSKTMQAPVQLTPLTQPKPKGVQDL